LSLLAAGQAGSSSYGEAEGEGSRRDAVRVLRKEFGLPGWAAREYALVLFPEAEEIPFLERLKRAVAARRASPTREGEAGGAGDERRG
jgi:hypothetical protein